MSRWGDSDDEQVVPAAPVIPITSTKVVPPAVAKTIEDQLLAANDQNAPVRETFLPWFKSLMKTKIFQCYYSVKIDRGHPLSDYFERN